MDARALAGVARLASLAALVLAACGGDPTPDPTKTKLPEAIQVRSEVFRDRGSIPSPYACPRNLQPPLSWSNVPEDAIEIAVTLIDPDAKNYVHWVVYGIPPNINRFVTGELPAGARQAVNDAGTAGYTGPCPPPGAQHRYVFMVSALSAHVAAPDGAPADQVLRSIASLTIDRGVLVGFYSG